MITAVPVILLATMPALAKHPSLKYLVISLQESSESILASKQPPCPGHGEIDKMSSGFVFTQPQKKRNPVSLIFDSCKKETRQHLSRILSILIVTMTVAICTVNPEATEAAEANLKSFLRNFLASTRRWSHLQNSFH